jgi:hypothetical protein
MLNWSRITKQRSKGASCCWDKRKFPRLWFGPENRCLWFEPRNILFNRKCLCMLNRSENTKQGSKWISGCQENCETLQPVLCHVQTAVATLMISFLDNRWLHSSPVSCFRTDSTPIITCKGRKLSAARIRDGCWETGLLSSHSFCEHSVSQLSLQQLIAFEPCFVFPDQINTFNHPQRPKTLRRANRRRPSSPMHAWKISVSQFFRLPLIAFKPSFVFPDRFDTDKHLQRPKTFCRANQRLRFRIAMESPFKAFSVLIQENLSNGCTPSISISFVWTRTALLKVRIGCKYLHAARFESGFCMWTVIREYLKDRFLGAVLVLPGPAIFKFVHSMETRTKQGCRPP